ncbi:MAG: trypsin-like peptidase domain-containing protein [Longimicrobiaceae bacterium]
MASLPNVRLQNLRDFTVQIRHPETDAIVGTGVVVSGERLLTCAHVIEAAGVDPRAGDDAGVGVYFAQALGSEKKERRAKVDRCFPTHDDDVVLLRLVDGPAPLAPEQFAVLGRADQSVDHPFKSFGYRCLENYQGLPAKGEIVDFANTPQGKRLNCEMLMLVSKHIDSGMSGAAVLDTTRNLVVGLIAEAYDPGRSFSDRDTGFAVDATVLTIPPFDLAVQEEDLPLRAAPTPQIDVTAAREHVAPNLAIALHGAPASLEEDWVGREGLLEDIDADWSDAPHRVTGLIGFGGEGKSSLARRWLDLLLTELDQPRPDGVFWWAFYDRPNVDEFFEAALKYMSGGKIDPRALPSANLKAHVIGAMLGAGRYLFVLDGMEVLQYQEGDQYGLLRNADLRLFLQLFAAPGHRSFCLVTSRAPLLDLMPFTTYVERTVDRLDADDGRALLRRLGVSTGADTALDAVVRTWDGHALTLTLLATYLRDRWNGDVAHIGDVPPPTVDEPRYARVHRVLRRYDEHLSEAERAFLILFSAFRTPVDESAFGRVFCAGGQVDEQWQEGGAPLPEDGGGPAVPADTGAPADALIAPVAALGDAAFKAMLRRLRDYRLVRRDEHTRRYTIHPVIRAHYLARLSGFSHPSAVRAAHLRIRDHYVAIAGQTPLHPTLDDLAPLIEAVYHACHAGAFEEAHQILMERVITPQKVLNYQLGAYETYLMLLMEFFPDADTAREPQPRDNSLFVLYAVAFCLMRLGRLSEAPSFFERFTVIVLDQDELPRASISYRMLATVYAYLGALTRSAESASEALRLARQAEDDEQTRNALGGVAWMASLRGELSAATAAFQEAEALERRIAPAKRYLYSSRGIQYAEHLRRTGGSDYARRVTESNLEICERNRWLDDLSSSHRVMGSLEADAKRHDHAQYHYDRAVSLARSISVRDVLIEALAKRGRWAARYANTAGGRADLDEALDHAVAGGYRILEADVRVGLAWWYLGAGDVEQARQEAARAGQMSAEMDYHWGVVDAAELESALTRQH